MAVFYAGDRVTACGLVNRPELNGQEGILKVQDPESERWTVKLTEDASEIALKEVNVELVLQAGINLRQRLPVKPPFQCSHFKKDKTHLLVQSSVQTEDEAEPKKPAPKPKAKPPPAAKKVSTAIATTQTEEEPAKKPVSRTSMSIGGMPLLGKKGGDGPLEAPLDFELVGKDSSKCRKCGKTLPKKDWKDIKPSPMAGNDLIFVKAETNGGTFEMVIDTGSQITVMSEPMMKKLRLEDRLDRSRSGVAKGAGSANILGDIRKQKIKIHNLDLVFDFTVVQMGVPLLLLGMDNLRKYRCIVDLDRYCVVFGGCGGVEIPLVQYARGLG